MSHANRTPDWLRPRTPTVGIAMLFAAFATVTVALADALLASLTVPAGATQTVSGVEAGGGLVLIIIESIAIVGLARLFGGLPEWLKKTLIWATLGVVNAVGWYVLYLAWPTAALILLLGPPVLALLWYFDVGYLAHNTAALALGMAIALFVGFVAKPLVLVGVMALLVVWDRVAVSYLGFMQQLVAATNAFYIPNYVVIPSRLQCDLSTVREYIADGGDGDPPAGYHSIIGVGDFAVPTALPVAVVASGTAVSAPPVVLSVAGIIAGAFVLASWFVAGERDLPGLVFLVPGVVGGYVVGRGVGVIA